MLRASSKNKRGAFILIVAFGFLTFVGIAGLAFESSYLITSRTLLQAALDGGAVKAAGLMLSGHSDSAAEVAAEQVAAYMVQLNTSEVVPTGPAGALNVPFIDATVTEPGSRIHIDGRLKRDVFLISALPNVPHLAFVSAAASAANTPVSLVIVLDGSGSMTDNHIPLAPPWPINETRFYWASYVLRENIAPLLRVGDQVALIKFSTGDAVRPTLNIYPPTGTSSYTLSPVLDRYTRDSAVADLQSAIDNMPIPGALDWTNTYDGLLKGQEALTTVASGTTRKKLLILVTDGAAALPDDYVALDPLSPCELALDTNLLQAHYKAIYDRTIGVADNIRASGTVVHTIGFTSSLTNVDTNPSSPYQTTTGGLGYWGQQIKPLFLARLANMQSWMTNPPPEIFSPLPNSNPYPYDYYCSLGGAQIATQPIGQYVFTFDPVQLSTALENMISSARVKLES